MPGNEYNGLANKNRIHDKLHALTNETLSAAVVSKPRRKSDAEQRQWGCREKNVKLTLDGKHEDRNTNHNCGAIDLVGDVIEDPGDFDQQPGLTAEFFLCSYVRRTRSRLRDMTSLGLHRSTPTCDSFLRSQ